LPANHPAPGRPGARSLLLFAGTFLLFALLPSRNTNYADDSLGWADYLMDRGGLINSHHLFLNGVRALWNGFQHLGLHVSSAHLLALYCSFFGALGLVFLDLLLRFFGLGRFALAGTLVCAFTAGWWSYSIVGDVYVPANAFMLMGCWWFLHGLEPGASRLRHGLLAVGSFFLMVVHHQAYSVFIVGLLAAVVVLRPRIRPIAWATAVIAVTGALVLALYVGVWRVEAPGKTFHGFTEGYAAESGWLPDQMRVDPSTLVGAAAGETRAFVSTYMVFRSVAMTRRIQTLYPYRNIYPYPYLVRRVPGLVAGLWALCTLIALALVLVMAPAGIWRSVRARDALAVLVIASIFQAMFFIWWEAISDEFWIWSLPFVAMTATSGAAALGRRGPRMLALLAVALGVGTLVGAVGLFAHPELDVDAVNDRFLPTLRARDLFIGFDEIQNDHRCGIAQHRQGFAYFNVFNFARSWSDSLQTVLDHEVASTVQHGGRVVVSPYLATPPRSYLVKIAEGNPAFWRQRRELVAHLRARNERAIVWPPLAASVPGYFLADSDRVLPVAAAERGDRHE
jgi:hypothetical protein